MRPTLRGGAAAFVLAALAPAVAAAQAGRVGPTVRAIAALAPADLARLAADSVAARVAAVTRGRDGVPVAHLFVRLASRDVSSLVALGATVGSRVSVGGGGGGGDGETLVSAQVPVASLARLAADGSVVAVYGARRWAPINDVGTALVGVASLRRQIAPDDFSGPVGRGVIVGLVDTGLDFTHPDFLVDSLGRSRVLYLWDQTLAGPGPGTVGGVTFGYGIECRQEDLVAAACPSRDFFGHGTHVLGTAAGDGSGTNGRLPAGQFAGVAPGADLIVVETTFLSDAIVDGVNYVFSRAAQLGRPAVVNLSLGSQWGPHDGTLPEEVALDSLEGPGRIVVAAAGNDGDNQNTTPREGAVRRHGAALLATGDSAPFGLSVPDYGPPAGGTANDYIVLQLWYAASDTVTVTVRRPDGSTVVSGPTGTPPATVVSDGAAGTVQIQNGPGSGIALTNDNVAFIVLGDLTGGTAPASGTWTITARSLAAHSGEPVHLWIADGTLGVFGGLPGVTLMGGSTNGYLVGAPATATRVLAVGAYVSRLSWTDANGASITYPFQERLGDLAVFSSPGPRRDGVLKPDLAAPGKGVGSALSRDAIVAPERLLADGAHWVAEGTSMATPFVTGAVALLLERDPQLTPEDVRTRLELAAKTDSFTLRSFDGGPSATPNPSWGYGKLFVPTALGTLVQLAALRPGSATDAIDGRLVPAGPFRVMHLLVVGDPDSGTVLDSLAVTAAGTVNEGRVLASLAAYRDPAMSGVVPSGAVPAATVSLAGAGDDPRLVLRVGPDTIAKGDTLALVLVARLDSGIATPSGQTVRFDVAAGDLFLRYASSRAPVAVQGLPFRGPVVTLQAPGQLAMRALPLGDTTAVLPSGRNTLFPVLRMQLAASGEPFVVGRVAVKIAGADPAAMVRVILDVNKNGVVDDGEPVLADTTAALTGDSLLLTFAPSNLLVPAGGSVQFVADVRTSGASPNGAAFGGAIVPAATASRALYSGLSDLEVADGPLSSGTVRTSLLAAGETLNLSENPVRGSSVVINYGGAPRRVAIYTFTGLRIRDFATPPAGNVVWDLTTDGGQPVVNGVYVVALDYGGSIVRHRIFVARRGGP